MDIQQLQTIETEIINFPTIKSRTKELNIIPWTNSHYELNTRNAKANAYSLACKQKAKTKQDDFICTLIGSVFCTGIMAALFLL